MDRYKGDKSDSDSASGTPRDDRFFTPRQSARRGGSSSDGESWATPRSTAGGLGWLSDEGEYATPREFTMSPRYMNQPAHQSQSYQHHAGGYSIPEGGYPHQPTSYSNAHISSYPISQGGHHIPEGAYPNQGYSEHHIYSDQASEGVPYSEHYAPSAHPPAQASYGWQNNDAADAAGYKYGTESREYWDQSKQDSDYLQSDYVGVERGYEYGGAQPKESEDITQAIDDIFSYARHNRVEEVHDTQLDGKIVHICYGYDFDF
jgi:hypothetical protein